MKHFRLARLTADVFALVALVYLMAQISGCYAGRRAGYSTIKAIRDAGDATGKALAAACQERRDACKAAHKIKTAEFAKCWAKCGKAIKVWKIVKAAVNTAFHAAWGTLEIARGRKKDTWKWKDALKPGLCALAGALRQWRELMPKSAGSLLAMLETAEGIACK